MAGALLHGGCPDQRIGSRPIPGPSLADHDVKASLMSPKNVPDLVQSRRVRNGRTHRRDANFLTLDASPCLRWTPAPRMDDVPALAEWQDMLAHFDDGRTPKHLMSSGPTVGASSPTG